MVWTNLDEMYEEVKRIITFNENMCEMWKLTDQDDYDRGHTEGYKEAIETFKSVLRLDEE